MTELPEPIFWFGEGTAHSPVPPNVNAKFDLSQRLGARSWDGIWGPT